MLKLKRLLNSYLNARCMLPFKEAGRGQKMNEVLEMIQKSLGKNLTDNGKCPNNCFECCSLTVGTNIMNFRKLKRILKKEHLEKYLSDDESLWWNCPFLINGKCTIYHNPSKPKICKTYTCSAVNFLSDNNYKDLFSIKNDSQKILFDLLPVEIKNKIKNNKRVKYILEVEENLRRLR